MAENNIFVLFVPVLFTSHFVNQEINPFSYVEITGLKIAEPAAAYNLLLEGVSGHDVERDGHLHIGVKETSESPYPSFRYW